MDRAEIRRGEFAGEPFELAAYPHQLNEPLGRKHRNHDGSVRQQFQVSLGHEALERFANRRRGDAVGVREGTYDERLSGAKSPGNQAFLDLIVGAVVQRPIFDLRHLRSLDLRSHISKRPPLNHCMAGLPLRSRTVYRISSEADYVAPIEALAMIYDAPRFFPGGDRYIEVELGDEMGFELNFRVHSLSAAIRRAGIPGMIELIPEMASLQVSYDPDRISYDDMVREIAALAGTSSGGSDAELESRLYYVPALYFDPWTAACVEEYRSKVADKTPDPDLLCELNHLADRRELVRRHS